MAKSIPITASCWALRLCSYLSFQFSFRISNPKYALAGTEDVWRVYARMANPCSVIGFKKQKATCLLPKLPSHCDSNLLLSSWDNKDKDRIISNYINLTEVALIPNARQWGIRAKQE
jgi:hypothetical protein